ncbi:MAG: NAD+ synthase [candidate division Zixibacteria bacterium]|nr:NAD+ synthase [candidate division Zixibacteria bacterium]MBU1471067.1 NAD+ synthase [candidate division Zixibacteria bacterium]MBU2626727.1 NAD+ synthase [candidate division Zixibacteria bacterium]
MSTSFRISLAQINPIVGGLRHNSELILESIHEAENRQSDIVLFPELALPGYPPEDLMLEQQFCRDNLKYLKELVRQRFSPMAVIGYVEECGGRLYNSSALICSGKLVHSYKKVCLPNYGVFDEQRYFVSGPEIPVYDLGDFRFGINICEDIWVNPGPGELQSAYGAGLVMTINSSPYHIRKSRERFEMFKRFAKRNGVYYAYVNIVGGQDELVFDGSSFVMDPNGELIALAGMFHEDLLTVDIPIEQLKKRSRRKKFTPRIVKLADQFPDVTEITVKYSPVAKSIRISTQIADPPRSREEEIYNALVTGTRDYIKKNGFTDVVIGLSGGIDSALTAAIAHDIVGSNHLHLVFMPTRYTSKESALGARKLAQNLGVKLVEYPIDGLLKNYTDTLSSTFEGLEEDVTEENIQARIRGNILMALANKFNWLVLNTGNKSEVAIGFCTLYGDTAGGFAILKDLYKTMVFSLARWMNRMSRKYGLGSIIPPLIISKPPSAELRENQVDTDYFPPYDILDAMLKRYVEFGESPREIAKLGFDLEEVQKVIRMVDINEYKRRQAAPGVKITPRGFGKDRRMPITNRYKFE